MTPTQFCNLILSIHDKIALMIQSGAAWEISLQTALYDLLFKQKIQVAREVIYSENNKQEHLDLLFRIGNAFYAIELKVESANTVKPATLLAGINDDLEKIKRYDPNEPNADLHRWVVAVAYSAKAKAMLREQVAQTQEGHGLVVAVFEQV